MWIPPFIGIDHLLTGNYTAITVNTGRLGCSAPITVPLSPPREFHSV
jgi:hypothetical protein